MRRRSGQACNSIMVDVKKGRALAGMLPEKFAVREITFGCVTCFASKVPAKNRRSASVQRTAQRADPVLWASKSTAWKATGSISNFARSAPLKAAPRSVWPGRLK